MNNPGYQSLISYKLAQIAFDLGWEFVPLYYSKYEDNRQRDQTCPQSLALQSMQAGQTGFTFTKTKHRGGIVRKKSLV